MSNGPPSPPDQPLTRTGIIIRLAFFLGVVFVSFPFLSSFLVSTFGPIVAGATSLCATGLLANLLTLRVFDRRSLADIGLPANPASLVNFVLGVAFAAGAAALMLLAPLLAGTGHLVARGTAAFSWPNLLYYLLALFVAAFGEEMIFRGYGFQLLVEKIGPFATILPVSVIFGLTHLVNNHVSTLGLINTMIWGVVLGYAFLRSRDLWLPIGLHFGWNVVLPLFGVSLSGHTIEITRYYYQWDLRSLWSGGDYGPEGGLLATVFVITLFVALTKAAIRPQISVIAPSLNEAL